MRKSRFDKRPRSEVRGAARWWAKPILRLRLGLAALAAGYVTQAGCSALLIGEIEALLAPVATGNALYVLDSVLFGLLAPLIY